MISDWVTVFCPVCEKELGQKEKGTLASFICKEVGCSDTKHFFYPNETRRPTKSIPWYEHMKDKNKCGKPCCEEKD